MKSVDLIFGLIIAGILIFYLIFRIYSLYIAEDKLVNAIKEYYESKGFTVKEISKLNFTDRIRYGAPLFSIFRIYSYQSVLMSGTIDYLRKVDVTSKKNSEYTKYIELSIKGKEIISLKEFASFDI
jgi:hypothetical protein